MEVSTRTRTGALPCPCQCTPTSGHERIELPAALTLLLRANLRSAAEWEGECPPCRPNRISLHDGFFTLLSFSLPQKRSFARPARRGACRTAAKR